MPIWHRSKKNQGPQAIARRKRALERLKAKDLNRTERVMVVGGKGECFDMPYYSEEDKKRIKAQIATLETRI